MASLEGDVVVPDRWSAARGLAGAGRDLPATEGDWERMEALSVGEERVMLDSMVRWLGLN